MNLLQATLKDFPTLRCQQTTLDVVEHFPYIGCHLPRKATIEAGIQYRICCVRISFRNMRNLVIDNRNHMKDAKLMVYKAVYMTTIINLRERDVGYKYMIYEYSREIPLKLSQNNNLYPMRRLVHQRHYPLGGNKVTAFQYLVFRQ